MTTKTKVGLLTAGLFLVMVSALVGSITSTIAWYMYLVRVTGSFSGTSVADAEQIQIGLRLTEAEKASNKFNNIHNDLSFDTSDNDQTILWAKPGKGLSSDILTAYLSKAGYAIRDLNPVTSGAYNDGEDLKLHTAPIANSWFDPDEEASTEKYVRLPITFRIINVATATDLKTKYVTEQSVWITDMSTSASVGTGENTGLTNIDQAIRVHVEDKKSNSKFIIKPATKDRVTGDEDENHNLIARSMNVGGLLKLAKGNDFYDQDRVGNTYREHIYGFTEAQNNALYAAQNTEGGIQTTTYTDEQAANNPVVNINGSPYIDTNHTTDSFTAKHGAGLCVTDYNGLMPVQHYYNYAQIKGDNSGANITGGKIITTTGNGSGNNDYDVNDYIGECVLTIWLEGWDHSVIDEELEHAFNLGIQFEVNSTRGS